MRIAEIYRSVQGEGFLTGTECVFIRASGCNLRCWYCDTPYASWSPEGEDLSIDEVLSRAEDLTSRYAVVTGGEPMLFAELIPLCEGLRALGLHITIETAGTLYLPVSCDLLSLSPKLSGSAPPADRFPKWFKRHEQSRHAPDVVRRLIGEHQYQVKFVIETIEDCREVERYLERMPEMDRQRVLLMPEGRDPLQLAQRQAWLEPYCTSHGLRYCPRRQIEWFGLVRGT
jgi:7-carboxy-7-deazaguanine synthase